MFKEFAKFLKDFNIISLAVGFVMGTASTSLVKSMVNDVLMPFIAPFMGVESWTDVVWNIGPIRLAIGSFAAELFNFVILAFIIFIIAKKLLKLEIGAKK
ncbi:MAG: MscL family protein [Parcubacteria group bacterium]